MQSQLNVLNEQLLDFKPSEIESVNQGNATLNHDRATFRFKQESRVVKSSTEFQQSSPKNLKVPMMALVPQPL